MTVSRPRALVFAYHDVGVRCLKVLLAHGVEVALVVTHADDPAENRWFGSVAALAMDHGLPLLMPERPEQGDFVSELGHLAPDFVFSFYYRHMIGAGILDLARRGALNMHGSLLPRHRGRAPVNWAVLGGDSETGASLHYMTEKPDAGDLVDQQAVPILPDDTAAEVMAKVTVAAELVLHRSLPGLIAGTAPRRPLDLAAGSYHGGRRPEDGRLDPAWPARRLHDLIRAVAPPYPGAFFETSAGRVLVERSRLAPERGPRHPGACLYGDGDGLWLDAVDGGVLRVLSARLGDRPLRSGDACLPLHLS